MPEYSRQNKTAFGVMILIVLAIITVVTLGLVTFLVGHSPKHPAALKALPVVRPASQATILSIKPQWFGKHNPDRFAITFRNDGRFSFAAARLFAFNHGQSDGVPLIIKASDQVRFMGGQTGL